MPFYDIDYDVLVWQLMPVRLRKAIGYAWLKCLVEPVKWLHTRFLNYRAGNLYRLAHNSQVAYMEAALNDTFDNVLRRIYLIDGSYEDPLFVYLVPEDKPLWLGLMSEIGSTTYSNPLALFTNDETSLLGTGFIVIVPMGLSFDMQRMRALVDLYRLAGRNRYEIVVL
jgi:hypothetical protein